MRKDDPEKLSTPFRAQDRVYTLNGQWYFQTREGDHGPYSSRAKAQAALGKYIAEMGLLDEMVTPGVKPTVESVKERVLGPR